MAATTTQKTHLIGCPACGKPIELHTTYDVHLSDIEGPRATARVTKATATLTMTRASVHHECPPKPSPASFLAGGGTYLSIDNPATREDAR